MNLYEFEGKKLLASVGIKIPQSQLLLSSQETINLKGEVAVKAQVLSGKRFKRGLVKLVAADGVNAVMAEMLRTISDGEKIQQILVEEKITGKEHFLSISYDTESRTPVVLYSSSGAVNIEENAKVEKINVELTKPIRIDLKNNKLNEVAKKL